MVSILDKYIGKEITFKNKKYKIIKMLDIDYAFVRKINDKLSSVELIKSNVMLSQLLKKEKKNIEL